MSNLSAFSNDLPLCQRNTYKLSRVISYYIGYAVLASIMSVVTTVLNGTFIMTMLVQKRIQKSISNRLVMILCIVDLLQGISTWPLTAANFIMFYKTDLNCFLLDLNNLLGYCLVALTWWTIFTVSLEQYIAILYPYFYMSKVTFCRLLSPMVVINILLVIINIVGKTKLKQKWIVYYRFVIPVVGVPMVLVLVYMNLKIIRCASQVASRITDTNKEEGKHIKSRAKAAKSCMIVILATIVCYCPSMWYIIYEKVRKPTPFMKNYIKDPSYISNLFSSVVDPIVYYWRLKSLRKATKDMFALVCNNHGIGHQ